MSENYIYLGLQENTFFFLHKIHNKDKFNSLGYSLDGQIMNCLINETMIATPDKRVIVYSIDTETNDINVTAMFHTDGTGCTYDKKDLYNQLMKCMNALYSKPENEDTLIFTYDYTIGGFQTFEILFDIYEFSTLNFEDKHKEVTNIAYYSIKKTIE